MSETVKLSELEICLSNAEFLAGKPLPFLRAAIEKYGDARRDDSIEACCAENERRAKNLLERASTDCICGSEEDESSEEGRHVYYECSTELRWANANFRKMKTVPPEPCLFVARMIPLSSDPEPAP